MLIEHPDIFKGSQATPASMAEPGLREIYNQYGQYQRFRQMSLDDMLLENDVHTMLACALVCLPVLRQPTGSEIDACVGHS